MGVVEIIREADGKVNSSRKWLVAYPFLLLLLSTGCTRTIELERGSISNGDNYQLLYIKSWLPFDVGDLWLKTDRNGTQTRSARLAAGYDLFLDVEVMAAERPSGRLVILEKRLKRAWTLAPAPGGVTEIAYADALAALGESSDSTGTKPGQAGRADAVR